MESTLDPWTTPAGPPPPGVVAMPLTAPGPWTGQTIAVMTMTSALVLVMVGLRVFTKVHVMRVFDYEDYVLVLACIGSLVYNSCLYDPSTRGARHLWNEPLALMSEWLYRCNIDIIVWHPAITFAKWAILLQLQRVFAVQKYRPLWWSVRFLIWASTIGYLTLMLLSINQCVPRVKIWVPETPGHCLDISGIFIAGSTLNASVNIGILCIPTWGLWTLKIKRKQKLVIAAMFNVNLLALGCSIGRVVTSIQLITSKDVTRLFVIEGYWAAAEVGFIIVATCMPTMPRLWRYLKGKEPRATGPFGRSNRAPQPVRPAGTWSPLESRDTSITPDKTSQRMGTSSRVYVGKSASDERGVIAAKSGGGILRTVDVEFELSGPLPRTEEVDRSIVQGTSR